MKLFISVDNHKISIAHITRIEDLSLESTTDNHVARVWLTEHTEGEDDSLDGSDFLEFEGFQAFKILEWADSQSEQLA